MLTQICVWLCNRWMHEACPELNVMVISEIKRNWIFLSPLLMSCELSLWHYGKIGNNLIEINSQILGLSVAIALLILLGKHNLSLVKCLL